MTLPLADVLERAQVDPAALQRPDDVVPHFTVAREVALGVWRELRGMVGESGRWPVLVGSDDDLARVDEALETLDVAPAQTLAAAEVIPVPFFFKERQVGRDEPPRGEWPADVAPHSGLYIPTHGAPDDGVHVALVPAAEGWACPAYLGFGGWNECPAPVEHVAVLRAWHRAWGAEVVGMSGDVVETIVTRPPRTRAAALKLAAEQQAYCPDLLGDGVENVEALAASLLNAPTWFFWWR